MIAPDRVATVWAFESAMFYFTKNHLWTKCDVVDDAHITRVTKAVNGGTNGLADRKKYTYKYYGWLKG